MLALGGVLLAANGLHFLLAWELFALSAYFLVTLERRRREVRDAGWLYLAASHAGTLCLFAYFTLLAAQTGTWELGPLPEREDLAPLYWLALVGFGIKAGVFPLHIWLPSAHASAPSHVSALLSGVCLKIGIFGLVRFSGWLPVPPTAGWVVAGLGVTSAVLGVAFALGQHDLKRLLAYHSVENIGIIFIGLGFAMIAVQHGEPGWGGLALAGALLHVWNHGLFKSLLFLGAGSVLHATGTREMSRLGGLWRAMPWTAALFTLGAVAISGLPPLNGFVSEWLILLGLFEAAQTHGVAVWVAMPAALLLGMTGALALACFVKVCGVVFLGAPRSAAAVGARESPRSMLASMGLLAAGCVAIGLFPAVCWPALREVAAAWRPLAEGIATTKAAAVPPELLQLGALHVALAGVAVLAGVGLWTRCRGGMRRATTWDCGYATPAARMQYTAGSFAATLVSWFDWILRPRTEEESPAGLLPRQASRTTHVPETVLDLVVGPIARHVMGGVAQVRRLQHGRLQAYLFYLVAGLVTLSLILWIGGGAR